MNLVDEAEAVMHYLQDRGLTPTEACAVMGLSITALISSKTEARAFIRRLASELDRRVTRD